MNFVLKIVKNRIVTENGTVVSNNGIHTYPSKIGRVKAAEAKQSLKHEARTSRKTTSQILSTVVGNLEKEVIANMPLMFLIKRTIQRVQDKGNSMSKIAKLK